MLRWIISQPLRSFSVLSRSKPHIHQVAAALESVQDILDAVGHAGNGLTHGGQPFAVDQFPLQPLDLTQILERKATVPIIFLFSRNTVPANRTGMASPVLALISAFGPGRGFVGIATQAG
jgi:hypothetical protein